VSTPEILKLHNVCKRCFVFGSNAKPIQSKDETVCMGTFKDGLRGLILFISDKNSPNINFGRRVFRFYPEPTPPELHLANAVIEFDYNLINLDTDGVAVLDLLNPTRVQTSYTGQHN
jgi:hypothetical protein